jgi:hypothetical protein
LSYAKDLYDAEAGAKQAKKNVSGTVTFVRSEAGAYPRTHVQIWSSYDEAAEEEVKVDESGSALPPQYLDVVVSSVKDTAPFGFSVQVLSTDSKFCSVCKISHGWDTDRRSTRRRCCTGEADEGLCRSSQNRTRSCWMDTEDGRDRLGPVQRGRPMVSIFSSFEICARLVDVMAMAGTEPR